MRTLLVAVLLTSVSWAGAALDAAKKHLTAGRLKEAVTAAEKVGVRDQDYARARYLMGEVQLALHDYEASVASFRAAAKAKPAAAPVLVGLGRALFAGGNAKDAVSPLEKAAKTDPKSARAQCFLGLAKWKTSRTKRGGKQIRRGAKLGAGDPEVARALVVHYLGDSDPEGAQKIATRFRQKRKKHPMGPFLEGLALDSRRKYDDAVEAYERALKLDDSFIDAHKNIAILCIAQNPMYRDRKKTDKAVKHADKYFTLGGKDPTLKRAFDQLKSFLPHLYKDR